MILILRSVLNTSYAIANPNPCFQSHASDPCIAENRHVSIGEALDLRRKSLALVSSVETSPAAVYDRDTLAVSCLASDRDFCPGPDSDCSACCNACKSVIRDPMCDLYCTSPISSNARSKAQTLHSQKCREGWRGQGKNESIQMDHCFFSWPHFRLKLIILDNKKC